MQGLTEALSRVSAVVERDYPFGIRSRSLSHYLPSPPMLLHHPANVTFRSSCYEACADEYCRATKSHGYSTTQNIVVNVNQKHASETQPSTGVPLQVAVIGATVVHQAALNAINQTQSAL